MIKKTVNIDENIQISECAKEDCVAGKQVVFSENEDRHYYAFHYITHGNGVLEYNGRETNLKAGDLFVIFPNKRIVYRTIDKWEYFWVNVKGKEILHLLKKIGITPDNFTISYKRDLDLIDLFVKLVDSYYKFDDTELGSKGYFYLIMSTLLKGVDKPKGTGKKSAEYYVQEALTFLQYNYYFSTVTLESLAKNLSISKNYLCSVFKQKTGISPMQYLTEIRIKDACKRLAEFNYPVSVIAKTVGYKDPLHFSREFKNRMGISPTEYRENINSGKKQD